MPKAAPKGGEEMRDISANVAKIDQLAKLLEDSLSLLSKEAIEEWLHDLSVTVSSTGTPAHVRLECLATIVGVTRTMLDRIETYRLSSSAKEGGGAENV